MYRRPHRICVAALVCQSGPALAIWEPGSACVIRVGQNQFPPLQALWNGKSGWRRNALNPASDAYGITQYYSIYMMILTRRGWLKHDEVQVGDQTVGYNETTGRSEWTPVTAVVHPGVHQVVRYGNSRVEFTTTPNHRWLMSEDTNPSAAKGFTRIQDRGKRDVLILAKEHHADDGLPITLEEAALLGWIAGDGWEEKARVSKATGRNAYCPHCGRGQKNRFRPATYFVSQTKKENWDAIEAAIDGHGTVTRTREYSWHGQARDHREWRLSATYARDLTERAGNPKTDCLNMVLRMSSDQRKAWLNAVFLAEGHEGRGSRSISQNDGPVMEAVKVAIYLEGYRPSINRRKEADRQHELRVAFVKPTLMVRNPGFFYEDAGEQEVWCVTTELGSFTAEQNGHIHLIGNSPPRVEDGVGLGGLADQPGHPDPVGPGVIKNTPGHAPAALVLPDENTSGDRNRRELNHHKRDCGG